MSLKGFAKHLAEHGKLASYDMFKDVLIRKEKTVDGKKKVYFEKIAVSDYALSQTTTTPGGEG